MILMFLLPFSCFVCWRYFRLGGCLVFLRTSYVEWEDLVFVILLNCVMLTSWAGAAVVSDAVKGFAEFNWFWIKAQTNSLIFGLISLFVFKNS